MESKLKKIDVRAYLSPFFGFNKRHLVLMINRQCWEFKHRSFRLFKQVQTKKKYDFNLSNRFTFNRSSTTKIAIKSFNTNNLNFRYWSLFCREMEIIYGLWFKYRKKTIDFQDNLTNQLWNARLQRTLKNDEFTALFYGTRYLNQNIGIQRNVYQNTISQEQNDRLKDMRW
jgi:hypothetical protein